MQRFNTIPFCLVILTETDRQEPVISRAASCHCFKWVSRHTLTSRSLSSLNIWSSPSHGVSFLVILTFHKSTPEVAIEIFKKLIQSFVSRKSLQSKDEMFLLIFLKIRRNHLGTTQVNHSSSILRVVKCTCKNKKNSSVS